MKKDVQKLDIGKAISFYIRPLGNEIRLAIMFILNEKERLSFSEIHDELLKRGYIVTRAQLAYHLGLLRNSRLISNEFKREGQIFSRYKLTEIGKKILEGIEKAIE